MTTEPFILYEAEEVLSKKTIEISPNKVLSINNKLIPD